MRSRGKRYIDDFKKILIEVYNSGKPVIELCSEYGVTRATLYKLTVVALYSIGGINYFSYFSRILEKC